MIAAAAYGLEFQARALAPFYHSTNASIGCHRFLVGTSCFTGGNKIHVLEYQDETKLLECFTVWFHKEEIFGLWSSPSLSDPSLLAVGSPSKCRFFRVPETVSGELEEMAALGVAASQVLWDLEGLQNEVRVVFDNTLCVHSLGDGQAGKEVSRFEFEGCARVDCAALDPHHSSLCFVSGGDHGLYLVDSRKKKPVEIGGTSRLHGYGPTRCIDFSCSKANVMVTSGDDGLIRWHDVRMTESECSLQSGRHIFAHDHTVPKALLNPFHDELLISCSSDNTLKLWDTSKKDTDDDQGALCLKKLADFGDSVVNACWSNSSPWVFAGVSYNGKVLVGDVPKEKKMEILLKDGV